MGSGAPPRRRPPWPRRRWPRAHVAARLDRERLLDALEAVRDAFQLLEPLDVVRDDLAPRARAGRADGVGGRDERAHHRHGLDVTVVADDAVDDVLREPIALEELSADDGVRALATISSMRAG